MHTNKQNSKLIIIALSLALVLNQTFAKKLTKGFINLKGKPAPAFVLKDMDGNMVNSQSLRGKWLFLHFWAGWCGPCRKELPAIEKLISSKKTKSIQYVFINTAETEDIVFSFFGQIGVELPSLLDVNGDVTEKYKPRGLPATFIIDPKGNMQYLFFGGRPWHTKPYINFLNQLNKQNK